MEPVDEYRADSRLIFFRLEELERKAQEVSLFRARQQDTMEKTQRDIDEAHKKLRLFVARERYKAWTAMASAVTAVVAAIVAFFHSH